MIRSPTAYCLIHFRSRQNLFLYFLHCCPKNSRYCFPTYSRKMILHNLKNWKNWNYYHQMSSIQTHLQLPLLKTFPRYQCCLTTFLWFR